MIVTNWPRNETGDAQRQEVETLDELWELVHAKSTSECDDDAWWVLEVSANSDDEVDKYLVLSWVEVQDPS
jgi:hypothetical protein